MQAVLQYPKIALIQPQGCLNAANALEFEKNLIAELKKNDISVLVVDLAAVDSLDSAGLMALLSAHKLAVSLGRSFQLCSVAPSIKIIFELTQLDRVFEILESEADLSAT
ncbi:MAG: STAS domain-containing protein [Nostoc sp. ChiSLP02]|nr:STAS domain-containing protein [Nostoc sp. DedSLP05]MDZ8102568.1 STAS domain-containing protein [Nostoc sp. DedSLP01]MDZ8184836.1 STAS domain-containing protein [Nostoc sp. ChiSLP02]